MRVLHVLDHSVPLHSGYTFRTLAILREQRRLGWETFHVTSPKQGNAAEGVDESDGFAFHRTAPASGPLAAWPLVRELALMRALERRLAAVAAQVRPDILHAHSPVLNAYPALAVGARLRIPVVYEVRAFWEDAAVDHGTATEGGLRYRAIRALETRALARADHVFTICEGLRADIVARGIAAAGVTVIPNAVDVESFAPSGAPDAALKDKLGLAGKTVIGFVGSYYAYEGLDLLVDTLPLIAARLPCARLLLVGGGPQEDSLKAQVARLGLGGMVTFVGRVPHTEVNRYYDLIDVLAYPRHSMRLTELVTPLKPLEAMAQGRLFVASDVGGHRELVRHGENGVLCRPDDPAALADALVDLLANPQRWPALKAAGRDYVARVRNWKASVANYAPVYARLTAPARRGPAIAGASR